MTGLHNIKLNHQTELLAPAGSYETFCAVVNAGADAVYAGGMKFGARAYAQNFSDEELIRAIEIAHLLGKKFYLTVNTLFKEEELKEVPEYLFPFYEAGLDAVLVQDLGLVRLLKQAMPNLSLHSSTQMNAVSSYGISYLEELGFAQVVLPRELSIHEIAKIHAKTPIKLESFVHGALCYSFSGQCLYSSMLGGRSGNRGRCAQPCRLSYDVLAENGKKLAKEDNILSLKDLCAIDSLKEMIDAGVYSFKIEGRMKQPQYAAGVTSVYRKYMDLVLQSSEAKVSEQDRKYLLKLGNRSGFTNGFLCPDQADTMVSHDNAAHEKSTENLLQPKTELDKLPLDISFSMHAGKEISLTLFYGGCSVCKKGQIPELAEGKPITKETIQDKITKLGNTPFYAEKLEIDLEEGLFCRIGSLNQLRREAVSDLIACFSKPKDSAKEEVFKEEKTEDSFMVDEGLSVTLMDEEQLETVLKEKETKVVYLDCHGFLLEENLAFYVEKIKKAGMLAGYVFPAVFREDTAERYEKLWHQIVQAGFERFLVRGIDELAFMMKHLEDTELRRKVRSDASLYSWNSQSRAFLSEAGIGGDTIPYELNAAEIRHRNNQGSTMVLYGRTPLMTAAQCVLKNTEGCAKKKHGNFLSLSDRYHKKFPVKTLCDICSIRIYNSVPTALFSEWKQLSKMGISSWRMDFTKEDAKEIESCYSNYRNFLKKEKISINGEFTYGHFKRGVQ
jgi:U32 family peptidase